MKKLLSLALILILVLSLCSCGEKKATGRNADVDPKLAEELIGEGYVDPINGWKTYDEMIDKIKSETNYAERAELMHEAEDILMSNGAVIPLYYYNDIFLQKAYVDGIYCNLFQTKFFMYSTMSNGAKTLKLCLASEPDYLDPALNSSVDGACLAANSFSGLYTYNAKGETVPACAEKYEVSDDGLTYTVTLKDGLKWSNGEPLTAADFEYSWKRATNPATAADYAYMFSGIDGYVEGATENLNVKASEDGKTLTFVLTAPCAYMEDLMAFPTFYPVYKADVEAKATAENPGAWCAEAGFVSNGAYTCTAWNHKTSMTYTKNPYWYDADKVTVENLEFMLSDDDSAIFNAYKDGSIDFADSLPTDEIANLKEDPEFHVIDALGTYYVAFNVKSALFDGMTPEQAACFRLALNMIIDREAICTTVGQTGQIAATSYLPIGIADGNGGVFKKDANDRSYYDAKAINDKKDETLAQARKYLEACGYEFGEDGKLLAKNPIKLNYLTNTNSGHIAAAEIIQQDFKELGIDMTISQQEWAVFLEERKQGNFDIAREGWIADFNDPINMLEMWITASGNNDCQYGRFEGWDAK